LPLYKMFWVSNRCLCWSQFVTSTRYRCVINNWCEKFPARQFPRQTNLSFSSVRRTFPSTTVSSLSSLTGAWRRPIYQLLFRPSAAVKRTLNKRTHTDKYKLRV